MIILIAIVMLFAIYCLFSDREKESYEYKKYF